MDSQELRSLQEAYLDIYSEERAPGVKPYKAGPTQAEVRADAKKAAKKKSEASAGVKGYGPEEKFKDWKLTSTPSAAVSQRMDKEAPYKTRPFSPLFTKQGSRTASAVTRATEGPGEPQSVTMPRERKKPKMVKKDGKWVKEAYDIVLEHLLEGGYADTVENAEAIMVNMSEDWLGSIVESYEEV
jgi:hypothetical protein